MRRLRIPDPERLEAALAAERYLLFKHSTVCSISEHAFRAYERFHAEHPGVPTGWIEVREERPWSQLVEQLTGVRHESPQALWLRDGAAVWHASHWEITLEALEEAVRA